MYNRLIQQALQAAWPLEEQIKYQLIEQSEQIVPILLQMIETSDKVGGADAIGIIGTIGYPENELALPTLIGFLSADVNDPRYLATFQVLFQMGPDVVVPHLIRALLDKGEPYHVKVGAHETSWAADVEGICLTISNKLTTVGIDPAYALRCSPVVNALLLQADPALATDRFISALLAVLEEAGETVDYVLPSLLALIKSHPESDIGKWAQQLLITFKPEALAMYTLLFDLHQ